MGDNNYSQPYNGVPFNFMQQQPPPPNAPPTAQGGQYPQHAPFQIPGLSMQPSHVQPSSSPSANQSSFGQNSQQPPFAPGKLTPSRTITHLLTASSWFPASRPPRLVRVHDAEHGDGTAPSTLTRLWLHAAIPSTHASAATATHGISSTACVLPTIWAHTSERRSRTNGH